jgi:hypothetical protein
MNIRHDGKDWYLTVGSFADKEHRVSLFLEDENFEVGHECTGHAPDKLLKENQVFVKDEYYISFLDQGVIEPGFIYTEQGNWFWVCDLSQKTQDFVEICKSN